MWPIRGHTRRERLRRGVRIARGQSLGIGIRVRIDTSERLGCRVTERFRARNLERSDIHQLARRVGGHQRRTDVERGRLGRHDRQHRLVHVERVVGAGLGVIDLDQHRQPRHDV